VAEANPIMIKELRSRMRGARAFVLMSVYLVILSAVTLLLYSALASGAGTNVNAGQEIGKNLFLTVGAVALIQVCLITPSLTSGAIAGERDRQTYDLLVSSLLTPWQIVWGKLASGLAFALLLVLSVVPLMSLAFLFGGVSLAEVLIALAALVATALAYAALGLTWSAVIRGSGGATAFSIGTVVAWLLIVPFLILIFLLIFTRDLSSDTFESPGFLYLSRIFMSMHPFIAMGMTEAALASGNSIWLESVTFSSTGRTVTIPQPWILYILFSLIATAAMLALCVRAVQPVPPAVAKADKTKKQGDS
jgi:ABC-2 type transport system permease protein